MPNIVFIASGDSMVKLGHQFQKELAFPESLSIVNAYMEQAVEYVRHHLPDDTDVIMARGNTAKLLKAAHIPVPIVTIPVKDSELVQSIARAVELYGEKDSQIAYIGMEDVIQSVSSFLDILHRKIRLYCVQSSQDIHANILRAKRENINVVIGGIYTKKLAEENGLKCVLLESTLESVKEAYERALEVQKGVLLQKKKLQERLIMMNAISDAIVGINDKGRISMFNAAAENLFKCSEKDILGKSYSTLFADTERAIINRILLRGDEIKGHNSIIRGQEYDFDFHPVLIKGRSKGIIITIKAYQKAVNFGKHKSGDTLSAFTKDVAASVVLIGEHPAFLAARSMAELYAKGDYPVFIIGESGTGKTTFARWIHENSCRKKELFLIRDALLLTPEDLLSANHGTLYIRNTEQLSTFMVAVINELLETHTIDVSNHTRQPLDIRLIAGSTADPSSQLSARLYYNLNTFLLPLPALRQRDSDILSILERMLGEYSQLLQRDCILPNDAEDLLRNYSWPGNISQLKSFCKRLAYLSNQNINQDFIKHCLNDDIYYSHLKQEDFPASDCLFTAPFEKKGFIINKRLVTYDELLSLDRYYQGHKGVLAEKLGISRSTLWRYFKIMQKQR